MRHTHFNTLLIISVSPCGSDMYTLRYTHTDDMPGVTGSWRRVSMKHIHYDSSSTLGSIVGGWKWTTILISLLGVQQHKSSALHVCVSVCMCVCVCLPLGWWWWWSIERGGQRKKSDDRKSQGTNVWGSLTPTALMSVQHDQTHRFPLSNTFHLVYTTKPQP